MAAGVGQVGGVGVEVLAAAAAVVLRTEQDDVAGPPGEGIAQVVEGAADEPIAGGPCDRNAGRGGGGSCGSGR